MVTLTNELIELIRRDSPSSSDAEVASESSSTKPRANSSGGGRVFSGMFICILSRGPLSFSEVGDSRGNSELLSPVMVLK